MFVSVIPIGNSKGIRIPKNIINELKFEDQVDLEVRNNEIIIRRVEKTPRQGWVDSFSKMHKASDDASLIPDTLDEAFEWEW
jgi:antitoxin MazE